MIVQTWRTLVAVAVEREHRRASLARREALLDAAIRVIAESGRAGVTHRAVTEAAGLPRATVSYFWSSIDDLADEALRSIAEREAKDVVAVASSVGSDPSFDAAAFAGAAAPRHPDTLAQFEMYLSAARDPRYREAVVAALESYRHAAEAGLAAVGLEDPAAAADAFVALADGFALHQLATGEGGTAPDYQAASRTLLIGSLVERGQIDEAMALSRAATGVTDPTDGTEATNPTDVTER